MCFVISSNHDNMKLFYKFSSSHHENNTSSESLMLDDDTIAAIFSTKHKMAKHVYDIQIDTNRYICYPVYLDESKYAKAIKSDENEEKNESKGLRLKMFNIVLIFQHRSKYLHFLTSVYMNLPKISASIEFEEYRSRFLSKELENSEMSKIKHNIRRQLEKYFESICITRYCDQNANCQIAHKRLAPNQFKQSNRTFPFEDI